MSFLDILRVEVGIEHFCRREPLGLVRMVVTASSWVPKITFKNRDCSDAYCWRGPKSYPTYREAWEHLLADALQDSKFVLRDELERRLTEIRKAVDQITGAWKDDGTT